MRVRFAATIASLTMLLAISRAAPAAPVTGAASSAPAPVAPTTAAGASPAPATRDDAHARFDLGLRLFEKGENAAALAEFKRAYELLPNPVVLYNMGLVYAAMDRPVEAADALGGFLSSGESVGSAVQRRHAAEVRDEQAARIAELTVVTDRPATIEIDGVEIGKTPLARPLRLRSGAHVVSALAPGCLPSTQQVTLAGKVAQTITMTLLPTERSVAHLALTASVPGAEVWINGQRVGTTPLPASVAVAPGVAHIELRRSGYRTATRELALDDGATASVALGLDEDPAAPSALKGRLRLAISEPGAEVSIDGVRRAMTGDELLLPAGPHTLRVEHVGFESNERQVEVVAGGDASLAITLTPNLETRARRADSVHGRHVLGASLLAGGLLLAAGAGGYAYFTRNDVSQAQVQWDQWLVVEMTPNPTDPNLKHCVTGDPAYTMAGCGGLNSYYQDQLDNAKLRRTLSYVGIGVGGVVAAVGAYLASTGNAEPAAGASSALSVWRDGSGSGFTLGGHF